MATMPKITPNLWFDTEAEEAANFYISIFDDSRIVNVSHYLEAGPRPAGTVEGRRARGPASGPALTRLPRGIHSRARI